MKQKLFFMLTLSFIQIALLFCFSEAVAQQLTAEKILLNVKQQFDHIEDYTAMLTAKVNMARLRVPQMQVKIYFKQPNKFHTESKNTSFLPRNIFDLNPSDLLSKFDATLQEKEQSDGKTLYKIRLISKPERGRPARESFVWVNGERWTIDRFEAVPTETRKIEVTIDHTVIDGKFVVPLKIVAKFDVIVNTDSLAEKIYSPQRVPQRGTVELTYSDYRINTGLSDDIFEKKEKK